MTGKFDELVPELPEVETIRRGLAKDLVGRAIEAIEVGPHRLRKPTPRPLDELVGRQVAVVRRHAKVLMMDFDDQSCLVSHLGMTGKWLFAAPDDPVIPHTHLRLFLDNETELRFSDPRRFGWLSLYGPGQSPRDTIHYGIDALDPKFDAAHLREQLASSNAPLKSFLLDQTKIAGIGNIYACEALWRSRLSPRRKARNTPAAKIEPLREAIVTVLEDSLRAGGTSFNDYVNSLGDRGNFLLEVAVFRREGEQCPRCATVVRRIIQSGRSTFYCPTCQR